MVFDHGRLCLLPALQCFGVNMLLWRLDCASCLGLILGDDM